MNLDTKDYCEKYKERYAWLNKIYNKVFKVTQEVILRGKYNYGSCVIVILHDSSYDYILDYYKKILVKNGKNIDDIFVSYYKKSSNKVINKKAFIDEMRIYKDLTVINHGAPFKNVPGAINYRLKHGDLDIEEEVEELTEFIIEILSECE